MTRLRPGIALIALMVTTLTSSFSLGAPTPARQQSASIPRQNSVSGTALEPVDAFCYRSSLYNPSGKGCIPGYTPTFANYCISNCPSEYPTTCGFVILPRVGLLSYHVWVCLHQDGETCATFAAMKAVSIGIVIHSLATGGASAPSTTLTDAAMCLFVFRKFFYNRIQDPFKEKPELLPDNDIKEAIANCVKIPEAQRWFREANAKLQKIKPAIVTFLKGKKTPDDQYIEFIQHPDV